MADPRSGFTIADEISGYPKTKAALHEQDTAWLQREYLAGMRDCFNKMFGRSARRYQNLVAGELIARGETVIPNLFGSIDVTADW